MREKDESEVLDLIQKDKVFELRPGNFYGRYMTIEEMIAIFDYFDAFWEYEGMPCPERPHARLKSGKHSNGFIMCKDVLKYPRMCELFAVEALKKFQSCKVGSFLGVDMIDVIGGVVSSAYSAISLGWEITRFISEREPGNPEIEYIPVEKDKDGHPTIIRGGIDAKKIILVVNELMTTGKGSTWETKQAALTCNGEGKQAPNIIEPSIVLVHRSKDITLADKSEILPVFHFDIEDWEPDECPYCKVGSEAIKPKLGNNWNILHCRE